GVDQRLLGNLRRNPRRGGRHADSARGCARGSRRGRRRQLGRGRYRRLCKHRGLGGRGSGRLGARTTRKPAEQGQPRAQGGQAAHAGNVPGFLIPLTLYQHTCRTPPETVMSNSIENKSAALRTKLKQLRAAQNPTDTRRGALLMRGRLFTWLATSRAELAEAGKPVPKHIAAFWSLEQEPDLRPLLSQLVEEEGITVSLPVVTGDDAPLQFRLWTPDTPMVRGAFGIE